MAGMPKSVMASAENEKPETNINKALEYSRNKNSMPGKYPARVVKVVHPNSVVDNQPVESEAYRMIADGLLKLTGEKKLHKAWRKFVKPGEKIGLKVNPVAGKLLTTSHAVVQAVVKQLEESGISRSDIVIWDRREMQLHETGFTEENYPGINIRGTEQQDKDGGFFDKDGILYGEKNIDKDWYYWADVNGEYDEYTLPYMVNGGKESYFTKIITQEVDKIINIPILKNAGTTVTCCMKNLAYGSISNTGRLHKQLWSETIAQVCAFPPLRDKVVLNIVDGLKGCFDGGPAANPQFLTNYKTILLGSDPVAVDRIAYDVVLKKRMEEGVQKKESPNGTKFMELASGYGLGEANPWKITLENIEIKA
ncbi:hypothetical protein JCM18694_16040 [Prolixibacter denitrificans]|nr:hypothetical protein JCM18694_16040 [Prolixibacter denitrificans]